MTSSLQKRSRNNPITKTDNYIMKKIAFMLMAASALCISCVNEADGPLVKENERQTKLVGNPFGEKEEGSILVRVSEKAIGEDGLVAADIIGGLEEASISQALPVAKDDQAARRHGLHKWYEVTFNSETSPEEAAAILAEHPQVEAVEYNSLLKATDRSESFEFEGTLQTKAAAPGGLPFNDPRLPEQWDMINDGSLEGSVAGADAGVKDAWRLTGGDPGIIVAIFDQGVAYDHKDLEKAMWKNTAEASGKTGVDDDENGYVDDIYGYNFKEKMGDMTYKSGGDHGTHIAGTIAATNNNGVGISSIAGGTGNNDGVRIMSCQIYDPNGFQAATKSVADAFYYAARHGACIAQCSYGYSDMEGMGQAQILEWMEESLEYKALMYFLDPANANCKALESNIAVFSAGNFNKPASLYPGAIKECISVTAICPDFLPGGYSNYGAGCDIAAPGGDIVRSQPNAPCMILSTGIGSNGQTTYVYKYGTSMACPHVTGVVALGMSYALKIGKKFSREDFISRLLSSADDIDQYQTGSSNKLWVSGGDYLDTDVFVKKGKMGTGAVNAWKFLMALEGTPSYIAKVGEKLTINIAEVIGEGYAMEISPADAQALGIENNPQIKNGILELTCTKVGSGKISFKASVGNDEDGVIPELQYNKDLSIVCRPSVASNGGWL